MNDNPLARTEKERKSEREIKRRNETRQQVEFIELRVTRT